MEIFSAERGYLFIFLDRIKKAYDRNQDLASLLVDPEFAKEIIER